MFTTTVHQTLRDDGNADYIEDNGPFAAINISKTYLGSGYYFWDNHLELSKWWGVVHCKDNFIICEGKFEINELDFFDLVGTRGDQIYFQDLIRDYNLENMKIGAIIEFLKDMERQPHKGGTFPFKAVRAVDIETNYSFKEKIKKFVEGKKGKMSLNPKLIICLFEKNKAILSTYNIIYPQKYV